MSYYNFRTVINSWLKTSKMKPLYVLKRHQNSAKIIHADNDKKGAFTIFWANFIPLQRGPYMTTLGLILLAIDALGIHHYPICASCIDMKCHGSCICSQSRSITDCSNCTHDLFFYDPLEGVRHPTLIQTSIQILVVTHNMERLCSKSFFKLPINSNEQYWVMKFKTNK